MTKLKSPATRGIVARLEDALGPLRASVTESLDGVARRLLREAKNLRAERDELIGKRHVEIERAAAAEQRAEAAEKEIARLRGLFGKHGEDCIVCGHSEGNHYSEAEDFFCSVDGCECTEIGVRLAWKLRAAAAEQRNTALEGALRAVLNDASIRPDGDTYIRLTDTDYRTAQAVLRAASPGRVCPPCLTGDHKNCRDEPDVGMECHCIHFRAALHDEERPQLGECVGHLGPPSNTAEPHPKGDTCSFWKPLHDEERSAAQKGPPCLCHQGISPDTCPHHGPLLAADEERSAPTPQEEK